MLVWKLICVHQITLVSISQTLAIGFHLWRVHIVQCNSLFKFNQMFLIREVGQIYFKSFYIAFIT